MIENSPYVLSIYDLSYLRKEAPRRKLRLGAFLINKVEALTPEVISEHLGADVDYVVHYLAVAILVE